MFPNYTHTVEEIEGIKCSVIEKSATPERVSFLKQLLELNGYKVLVKKTEIKPAPPKPAVSPAAPQPPQPAQQAPPSPPLPETWTIGVTDITFNPVMEVYEKNLKTPAGELVTPTFWQNGERREKEFYWRVSP